jgi:hypothetical protein
MKVFILCTIRKNAPYQTSTLTFDSIRTGFPDADVHVDVQGDHNFNSYLSSLDADVKFRSEQMVHGDWIRNLVMSEEDPFVIADPDLVFFSRFPYEQYLEDALAGDYVPAFKCPVAKCKTEPRFHTSLLCIHPLLLRCEISKWKSKIGVTQFTPHIDLFKAVVIPTANGTRFYDTCSLLFNSIGGKQFCSDTLLTYSHIHAGTWSDIVEKSMPGFQDMHRKLLSDPKLLRASRAMQNEFYEQHA